MKNSKIQNQLFDDQIKLIQNMNKLQLLAAFANLAYKLKEDSKYPAMADHNYSLLKHAVEAGLTY
jgi:hypothetical protein